MEVETREVEEGTEITVFTDQKVAVVVRGEEERIYLPEASGSDSSYYVEHPEQLLPFEGGYRVVHRGKAENVEILG